MRVVGEHWSPHSHELREVLARNTVPFGFYAADSDEGRQLLRDYGVDAERLPAVILHDGSVLHNPTFVDVADALGVHAALVRGIRSGDPRSGASRAVGRGDGASEGLRTLVIEAEAIGGQAGTSSMIRNYLGFPRGISGGDLAFRTWEQALLFGAEFVFRQRATKLTMRGHERTLTLSDGSMVIARTVIIAAGVEYRRLGIPALERLVGVGVF